MKKLLILLALLLCLAPAMAEEPAHYVDGNYRYYLTDGGAVLTNYLPEPGDTGAATFAVLPAKIAGHPVVGCEFVFSDLAPLEKIIVQNGVTDFGDAFDWSFFSGEIVLPASLDHIAEGSLFSVRAEITVSGDNPHFTCEDGFLIDTRTDTLLYVAPSAAEKPLPAVRRLGDLCLEEYLAYLLEHPHIAVFENGVLQSARSSVREMSVVHTELAAVLSCRVTLETMCTVLDIDLRYTLYTDGVLHICAVCMTEIPSAVTFGFSLDGSAVGREIGWYGLGWKASTFGERDGSLIGRYSARVEEIADPSSAGLSLRRKTRYIVCDMTNGRVLLCTDQKLSFGVQKEKIYLLSDDGNALSVAVKPYVCEEEARESIRVSYDVSDK